MSTATVIVAGSLVLGAFFALAWFGFPYWLDRSARRNRERRRGGPHDRPRRRVRLPLFALRVLTWRRRCAWARKHIPADPYAQPHLSSRERAVLSAYEKELPR